LLSFSNSKIHDKTGENGEMKRKDKNRLRSEIRKIKQEQSSDRFLRDNGNGKIFDFMTKYVIMIVRNH